MHIIALEGRAVRYREGEERERRVLMGRRSVLT
jgi:hypothetical protein